MKVHLEYRDAKSSKFWKLEVAGSRVTVRYGRIGSTGQTKTKDHSSPDAAQKEAHKLVASKKKKGYTKAKAAKKPKKRKPAEVLEHFWKTIERARKKQLEENYDRLRSRLTAMGTDELSAWDAAFRHALAGLYNPKVAGAAIILFGGCSDDTFEGFALWVISRGKKFYDKCRKDPDSLVKTFQDLEDRPEFEALLYLANEVHEEQTGSWDLPANAIKFRLLPDESTDMFEWEDEQLEETFPRLFKACEEIVF